MENDLCRAERDTTAYFISPRGMGSGQARRHSGMQAAVPAMEGTMKNTWHRPAFLEMDRASLAAQLVKNPPAMRETPVRFLSREDPLENG